MKLLVTAFTAASLCVAGASAQYCGTPYYGPRYQSPTYGYGYGGHYGSYGHQSYPRYGGYYNSGYSYPRYGFNLSFGGGGSHYQRDYRYFRRQGYDRDDARYSARHHGYGGRGQRGGHRGGRHR